MDGIIYQIEHINKEIKNLLKRVKTLRIEKNKQEIFLVKAMKTFNVQEYKGFKLSKLDPTRKPKRKKPAEKRDAMMRILRDEGIEDPAGVLTKIKIATKPTIENDSS